MDDRILYNPDNRFLASSGSNDFSLYGAPSDPALWFAPADTQGASAAAAPSPPAQDAPADTAPDPANSPAPASTGSSASSGAADAAPGAAPALPPSQFAEAVPSATAFATPLAPFSGGFTAPPAVDRAELAALPEPAATPPAAAAETVSAFAPAPAATVEAAAATASGTALPSEVQDTIGPATTGPLAEVLPGVPAALEDGVTDLLGSDPAGGIATLVSLVTISEVLDLQPVTAAGENAIVVSAPSMIDALAADALGDTAPPDVVPHPDDAVESLITIPLPVPDDDLPGGLG